jgi:aminoglycoside 6'-N-acetyltransferase I
MACGYHHARVKMADGRPPAGEHVIVRPVRASDADQWLRMRQALWPDGMESHLPEIQAFFADPSSARETVLVAEYDGVLVGFVELSLRPYAEGCKTTPVAYLEGWFVSNDVRGAGVGRALLRAAEEWGRAQGCTEFASDTEFENAPGADAHRACGFEDVGLIRCFRKRL